MANNLNSNVIEGNPGEVKIEVAECIAPQIDEITHTLVRVRGNTKDELPASGIVINGQPYVRCKTSDWEAGCYLLQAISQWGTTFTNHSNIIQLKVDRS